MKNAIKLNGTYFYNPIYILGSKKLIKNHRLTHCKKCGSLNVVRLMDKKVGVACTDCGYTVVYKREHGKLRFWTSQISKTVIEKPVLLKEVENPIKVRCENCEYNDSENDVLMTCSLLRCPISKNGYCSYGIPKGGQNNG